LWFRSQKITIFHRSWLNLWKTCQDFIYLVVGMFMDKVKNIWDHSMILWKMAGDLLTNSQNPPLPTSFRIYYSCKSCRFNWNILKIQDIFWEDLLSKKVMVLLCETNCNLATDVSGKTCILPLLHTESIHWLMCIFKGHPYF
jgi:hypothetical protein